MEDLYWLPRAFETTSSNLGNSMSHCLQQCHTCLRPGSENHSFLVHGILIHSQAVSSILTVVRNPPFSIWKSWQKKGELPVNRSVIGIRGLANSEWINLKLDCISGIQNCPLPHIKQLKTDPFQMRTLCGGEGSLYCIFSVGFRYKQQLSFCSIKQSIPYKTPDNHAVFYSCFSCFLFGTFFCSKKT